MDIFGEKQTKFKKIRPNKHLQSSLSIIYYLGFWAEWAKYKYLYNIYTTFNLTFLLGIIIVSNIVYVIINWGNIEAMMASLSTLMTYSTYATKVMYIICRRRRIKNLIDITNSEMFNRDNDKYEHITAYYTWQAIFHQIAYQTFGFIAVISWGSTPILYLIRGTSKQLPMVGWYPYNVTSTPVFEFTSLHQFVVICTSCINNIAIDTLATGFIVTACCQLTILNYNISSIHCIIEKKYTLLNDNVSIENSTLKVYSKMYEDLKHCIEHTIMIFDFSKQIQDVFGTLIFVQLLVNCIVVCATLFNISQMKDYVISEFLGILLYTCCVTYQIFIYCWHGNELHFHSMRICSSAYANNWWDNSKDFKHALLIIMARAQWPLILIVGNVMELSLQNFVLILRTSYSIFTVLRTSTAT
ncbi:odorant receptor Or2-like isoform X1 [Bombus pyrosoma]|uniref:odorant receptor Or2-like isoform X1 n=1 Tax=Bombus pyrosoma TaxID=396416 RepID=UPI001CB8BDAF|nr:odorant receptor Or2-like isoform X1 [Bombus pyrosoma]